MKLRSLLAGIAVTLAGCTGSNEPPKLDGALLNPPVYVPSKLVDRGGFRTGDSLGGLTHHGYIYKLESPDDFAKVCAFYEKSLPGAEPDDAATDTRKTWSWKPPAAEEGEYVEVTVQKFEKATKIAISDVVSVAKREPDF
jgi:hypothetical protein